MQSIVLSTGGTIASTSSDEGATPTKEGHELIDAVPELEEYGDIDVEQITQVLSFEMDRETLETIGHRVKELDADDSVDAIVITHGTDTMEETAYYLDVALQPETPVLLTGAQRRPDEVSPDGPSNLRTSFRAAAAFDDCDGEGVFVAFNEEIHAAQSVTKTHTSKLETFVSVGTGPVATMTHDGITIHRDPRSETDHIPTCSVDSAVYTLASGIGVTGNLTDAALEHGVEGFVINGTGLGNVTKSLGKWIEQCTGRGIPVIITSRCLEGQTAPVYGSVGGGERLRDYGALFAGDLPAQKARIKLMLALNACEDGEEGNDGEDTEDRIQQIQRFFSD
jgi:L-asparaginase